MSWAPNYVTSEELKAFVRIDDAADDVQIGLAIAAASRSIDRACNRQFGTVDAPEARYYTASYDRRRRRWVVEIDDLSTSVALAVAYDSDDTGAYADAITDYQLKDVNAAANGLPWTRLVVHPNSDTVPGPIEDGVEVTGTFGWAAVPDTIKEACLLQASRVLARRDSPYGVAGSPEAGNEIRLLSKLDPDVALAVRPYYRWWGAR